MANQGQGAGPTAVVAALPAELEPLRARVRGGARRPVGEMQVTVGTIDGAPLALAVTGDGAVNARRGLAALAAAVRPSRVIIVGVAGALSPSLARGAVVLGARVIDEATGAVHEGDAAMGAAAGAVGVPRGVVVSAERIADTVDEKRRLFELAAARSRSSDRAVVDLESAAFAAAASRANLPWVVLRAVSDLAHEALPDLLNRSRDARGAVSRLRVLGGMLARPGLVRPLLELHAHVGACARSLADTVQAMLLAETFRQPTAPAAAPTGHRPAAEPTGG